MGISVTVEALEEDHVYLRELAGMTLVMGYLKSHVLKTVDTGQSEMLLLPPDLVNINGPNASANWEMLYQKFQLYFVATGQANSTDEVKYALLLSLIGEDTLCMYNTFKFSGNEGHNSNKYADVVAALRNYCTPKKNTYKMFKFLQFLPSLKMLIRHCKHGEQEESIVYDRIIQGCEDCALQEVLLRLEDTSLGKIAQHCRVVELSTMQAKQISAASSFNTDKHIQDKQSTSEGKDDAIKCSHCNSRHRKGEYPVWGRKCNKCGKLNYFAVGCRVRQVRALQASQDSDSDCFELHSLKIEDSVNSHTTYVPKAPDPRVQWKEVLKIEHKNVVLKLDTGSELYKYTPSYGVAQASEEFLGEVHNNFGDIPNCMAYIDDLLCYGETEDEHDRAVKSVLEWKSNLPKNLKELQCLLGMFNYVRPFLQNMSEIEQSLQNLRKSGVMWQWLPAHDLALQELKDLVSWAPYLRSFDSSLPIILQCDATQSGTRNPSTIQETFPYERVSAVILAFGGKNLLIINDAYSNWVDIVPLQGKNVESVVDACTTVFAVHGDPQILVSDNIPFNSREFRNFAKNRFELQFSSPRYAQNNGLAEKGEINMRVEVDTDSSEKNISTMQDAVERETEVRTRIIGQDGVKETYMFDSVRGLGRLEMLDRLRQYCILLAHDPSES
ncbi:hypothetical protein PR048_006398 [Dryococelus australis]|uniref:Integrase catalytic domain-containing protein n=1 Tax=Dryococelus australis TaxID=614101 RepID=A0ABQ9IBI7_9NEOP|nr:hypothetical protein PR048_006398 [Dryococelus australis]